MKNLYKRALVMGCDFLLGKQRKYNLIRKMYHSSSYRRVYNNIFVHSQQQNDFVHKQNTQSHSSYKPLECHNH